MPFTFQISILNVCNKGVHVVIVTFSNQTQLIRDVIAISFPPDTSAEIIVRGLDGTWLYDGSGSSEGKQGHIASACEELNMKYGSNGQVSRRSTILIDDECENVEAALKAETNAILFNSFEPEIELINSLLMLPKVGFSR